MTCKQLVDWNGRVCFGKLFEISYKDGKPFAICNKCQHEYKLEEKENEE